MNQIDHDDNIIPDNENIIPGEINIIPGNGNENIIPGEENNIQEAHVIPGLEIIPHNEPKVENINVDIPPFIKWSIFTSIIKLIGDVLYYLKINNNSCQTDIELFKTYFLFCITTILLAVGSFIILYTIIHFVILIIQISFKKIIIAYVINEFLLFGLNLTFIIFASNLTNKMKSCDLYDVLTYCYVMFGFRCCYILLLCVISFHFGIGLFYY